MADISKNIQSVHDNGAASISIGIKDDKIQVKRDSIDNTVAIKNSDGTLSNIKVNKASISSEPNDDTDAVNKKYVDESVKSVPASIVTMKTWTAADIGG